MISAKMTDSPISLTTCTTQKAAAASYELESALDEDLDQSGRTMYAVVAENTEIAMMYFHFDLQGDALKLKPCHARRAAHAFGLLPIEKIKEAITVP